MSAYLLLWNPKKWDWTSLEADIVTVDLTGRSSQRWSCGVTKSIQPGDRIFLLRVGREPKGIIGAGFAYSNPFYEQHWSGEARNTLYIDVDFEVLLNADIEPVLLTKSLETGLLDKQNWHPQASGTSVKSDLLDELEQVWFRFLSDSPIRNNPFVPSKEGKQKTYFEGKPTEITLTKYERNPYARKKCIEHYGYSCVACGFNFEQAYGEIGRDYIHVHHLEQMAAIGSEYEIDPIKDLRPVCANCHSIIHKKREPFRIEDVKKFLMSPQDK
ncbi:MAG: HNH endonuclease [Pyrinomonadaceae bacterium]